MLGTRPGPGHFEPTRWSLVLQANAEQTQMRTSALEALAKAYWYPLYAFLRRSGRSVEDAQDLTQDFFAQLMNGSLLAGVDPARGKFRTLLLTGLSNLSTNAYRATQAQKRGGRVNIVSLDEALAEEKWQEDVTLGGSPERAFDRAWAVAVVDRAAQRLRDDHQGTDREPLFRELMPRLTGSADDEGLAAIGERLGMTEAAVKMALFRLRRRYADALQAEVADTVGQSSTVQEELRYLMEVIT